MLLAVEGGGFFSSSATGYSKGLALLILGQKNEERPMRVSPWNQYQLVDHEAGSDLQLASKKNQASRGWTSFFCFGRASSELCGSSPPAAGSACASGSLADPAAASDERNSSVVDADENIGRVCLKSSLKKHSSKCAVIAAVAVNNRLDSIEEEQSKEISCEERRGVHWTDAHGRELAEIREFEVSEDAEAGEEELDPEGGNRKCQCTIM